MNGFHFHMAINIALNMTRESVGFQLKSLWSHILWKFNETVSSQVSLENPSYSSMHQKHTPTHTSMNQLTPTHMTTNRSIGNANFPKVPIRNERKSKSSFVSTSPKGGMNASEENLITFSNVFFLFEAKLFGSNTSKQIGNGMSLRFVPQYLYGEYELKLVKFILFNGNCSENNNRE